MATTTPAPIDQSYMQGLFHGVIFVAILVPIFGLLCFIKCSCRCRQKTEIVFCRDVATMSQTSYLARHRYDAVRGHEGDVEVRRLYIKGQGDHQHSD